MEDRYHVDNSSWNGKRIKPKCYTLHNDLKIKDKQKYTEEIYSIQGYKREYNTEIIVNLIVKTMYKHLLKSSSFEGKDNLVNERRQCTMTSFLPLIIKK